MRIHKDEKWMNLSALFLPVLLFCVLFLGVSLARYENRISQDFILKYGSSKDQVVIRTIESLNGEETQEGYRRLEFVLSNGNSEEDHCTFDQTATLLLFATAGVESSENYKVSLTDGEVVYESQWFQVVEGSSLYAEYGPGWILRFYNPSGEEASWHLFGEKFVHYNMYIQIEGKSNYPAVFHLIANGKPGSNE